MTGLGWALRPQGKHSRCLAVGSPQALAPCVHVWYLQQVFCTGRLTHDQLAGDTQAAPHRAKLSAVSSSARAILHRTCHSLSVGIAGLMPRHAARHHPVTHQSFAMMVHCRLCVWPHSKEQPGDNSCLPRWCIASHASGHTTRHTLHDTSHLPSWHILLNDFPPKLLADPALCCGRHRPAGHAHDRRD